MSRNEIRVRLIEALCAQGGAREPKRLIEAAKELERFVTAGQDDESPVRRGPGRPPKVEDKA